MERKRLPTVAQRLELIEQIWNSLPEAVAPEDVPPAHLAELAWRYNDFSVDVSRAADYPGCAIAILGCALERLQRSCLFPALPEQTKYTLGCLAKGGIVDPFYIS